MDLSSTELFVEILLAGVLFVIGFSPFLLLSFPDYEAKSDPLRVFGGRESWLSWLIVVAIVYPVGIAGNRLAEIAFERPWVVQVGTSIIGPSVCLGSEAADAGAVKMRDTGEAEIIVRRAGAAAQFWVERHKTYRKLLRAGAVSSAIFVIGLGAYRLFRPYSCLFLRGHCVVAVVFFFLFMAAGYGENCHYYRGLERFRNALHEGAVSTGKSLGLE